MGTRADFYDGRGQDAEWLGSIAWDGHPESVEILDRKYESPDAWRVAVASYLTSRDDATSPEMGWPWPWNDSGTTDYAYALDDGSLWGSRFGGPWFSVAAGEPDEEDEPSAAGAVLPDMSDRKNVTFGKRSGVLFFSHRGGAR